MSKFKCHGFKPLYQGNFFGYCESTSDAAKIFGERLAKRHGKSCYAIVSQDSYTSTSALYQVTIVKRSGVVVAKEYLHITVE